MTMYVMAKRFCIPLAKLSEHLGGSIPFACQDWASTKAAYRFLANERVSEEKILAEPLHCTRERFTAAVDQPVLALHDTTEFSYHRADPEAIGILQKLASPYANGGQPGHHTTCGLLMHSSLVVTTEVFLWDWRRSSSGPGASSTEQTRSSAVSIQPGCRSNKRRAFAGLRTSGSRRPCWLSLGALSTSAIAKAMSTNCSRLLTRPARIFR